MAVAGALSQVGSQRLQHLPKIARVAGPCSTTMYVRTTTRVRETVDGQNFANWAAAHDLATKIVSGHLFLQTLLDHGKDIFFLEYANAH